MPFYAEPLPLAATAYDPTGENPSSLSVTELPNGKGFAAWAIGLTVRYGTTPSVDDLAGNSTVTGATTMLTAVTAADGAMSWHNYAGLFIGVVYRDTPTTYVRIYKANSDTTPTSFTLYSTVTSGGNSSYTLYRSVMGSFSIPHIVSGTNRWVMFAPSIAISSGTTVLRQSAWTSDDGGITWTVRSTRSTYGSQGHAGTFACGHVGELSGRLYWAAAGDSGAAADVRGHWIGSDDNGSTWATIQTAILDEDATDRMALHPFATFGGSIYATRERVLNGPSYDDDERQIILRLLNPNTSVRLNADRESIQQDTPGDFSVGARTRWLLTSGGTWLMSSGTRIYESAAAGGWYVGFIGMRG